MFVTTVSVSAVVVALLAVLTAVRMSIAPPLVMFPPLASASVKPEFAVTLDIVRVTDNIGRTTMPEGTLESVIAESACRLVSVSSGTELVRVKRLTTCVNGLMLPLPSVSTGPIR
ncbi:hypothetical protein D3C80_1596120 [compost metagenome]